MPFLVTRHLYDKIFESAHFSVEIAKRQPSSTHPDMKASFSERLDTLFSHLGEGEYFNNMLEALTAAKAVQKAWEQTLDGEKVFLSYYDPYHWGVVDFDPGQCLYKKQSLEDIEEWSKQEEAKCFPCARAGCQHRIESLDGVQFVYQGWYRLKYTYCSSACLEADKERAEKQLQEYDPLRTAPPLHLYTGDSSSFRLSPFTYESYPLSGLEGDEYDYRRAILTREAVEALLDGPDPLWTLIREWQKHFPKIPMALFSVGTTPLCTLLTVCFQSQFTDGILDLENALLIEDAKGVDTWDKPYLFLPPWAHSFSQRIYEICEDGDGGHFNNLPIYAVEALLQLNNILTVENIKKRKGTK